MRLSFHAVAGVLKPLHAQWWIIGGFSLFLVLLLIAGSVGIYSLDRASLDSQGQLEAVDLAREAQIEFQDQFYLWKSAVNENPAGAAFRSAYHEFSYKAAHVQDLLFNLNSACSDNIHLRARIDNLIATHKKTTSTYIRLLVDLGEHGPSRRPFVLDAAKGSDTEALGMMDDVAREIMKNAGEQNANIRFYYGRLVSGVLAALAVSAILMSIFVGKRLISMHRNLESLVRERTRELESALAEIALSEERQRFLVEGTNDIVFSLDEEMRFTGVNRALKEQLHIRGEKIIGLDFMEILYSHDDHRIDTREFVRTKTDRFMIERQPLVFTTDFRSASISEPKEYTVRLEYITIGGKTEIIGRATPASVYALIHNIHYERQKFSIGNYLGTVEDMTHHLTRNLHERIDSSLIGLVRLALREIILNSIEHGNLAITFDEKTAAMAEDRYFALIAERQIDPAYRDRKITIEYQMDDYRVAYLITDEGSGFDHLKHVRTDDSINDREIPHGRGISMATNIFTSVRYNKKGNSVLLEKIFEEHDSTGDTDRTA